MSPTTIFTVAGAVPVAVAWSMVGGRCTRGGAWLGGPGEGYTGTQAQPVQDPNIEYILALGPTHGQMKLNLRYFMRFPRIDPHMDPE